MRILVILLATFLSNSLFAQQNIFKRSASFYRLENIDSLKKYSLDSLRGELLYFGINDSTVHILIFPITIFNSFDSWTNDNQFNFVTGVDSLTIKFEASGKLKLENGIFNSNMVFFKRDIFDLEKITYLDSLKKVTIKITNDSLFVNNKYFKEDKKLRIFQRFTGY